MTENCIQFVRHGKLVSYKPQSPTQTVLDYIRLVEHATGTKEGCNEGDCGACTVAIGSLQNGRITYEPVNACILLIGQLHGKELVTVEDLAKGASLHPVQQAMVDCHGSQCGFCTPGFVMSLFTLYQSGIKPTRQQIVDHLAGNLCRCTGYRPIIDAASRSCTGTVAEQWKRNEAAIAQHLSCIPQGDVKIAIGEGFLALPTQADTLAALSAENPDATIVAGATDIGLWVTKQFKVLPKLIHTHRVAELHQIAQRGEILQIGAAATYAEAMDHLSKIDSDIGTVMRRIGSAQVRASGTIGGNIANGSPIGDMPPMLIALGVRLHLRLGDAMRDLALEDFFIDYGKQDRAKGELVWRIDVPLLKQHEHFRAYKISKRFDQDISAVMAAFKLGVENDRVATARIAFGGMAATPKRAKQTEAALIGVSLHASQSWDAAIAAMAIDFAPISDMRASKSYRLETAVNLLRKALTEIADSQTSTRVTDKRMAMA
jgi:xanthine dehydrogenase small subunit